MHSEYFWVIHQRQILNVVLKLLQAVSQGCKIDACVLKTQRANTFQIDELCTSKFSPSLPAQIGAIINRLPQKRGLFSPPSLPSLLCLVSFPFLEAWSMGLVSYSLRVSPPEPFKILGTCC